MNKFALLLLPSILFASISANAQTSYFFLNNNSLDTISNYQLKLYYKTDILTYTPDKNNALTMEKKLIGEADSVILHFDYWYKEKIPKTAFSKNTIYVNKQIPLRKVIIKDEHKTIGTFKKNHRSLNMSKGHGDLVSFKLNHPSKIEEFKILVHKNKVENSAFVPILFMADSIDDPNKLYLYPKGKLFELKDEFRNEWINIPIEEYSGPMKSQIFAGYVAKSSDIIFGTARAKTNTFLDDYHGNTRAVLKMWGNEYVYRIEDYYVAAVKIKLEF